MSEIFNILDSQTEYTLKQYLHKMTVNLIEHTNRSNKAYGYILIEDDLKGIERLLGLSSLDKVESNKIKKKLVSMVEQTAKKYLSGETDNLIPVGIFDRGSRNKKSVLLS